MIDQLISNLISAQKILIILKIRRLEHLYPIISLIKHLKKNLKELSIFSINSTSLKYTKLIASELETLFIKEIISKTYVLNIKSKSELNIVDKDTFNGNNKPNKKALLEFEMSGSKEPDIKDFSITKKLRQYNSTIFFGDFTQKEIGSYLSKKELGEKYVFSMTKPTSKSHFLYFNLEQIYPVIFQILINLYQPINSKALNYYLAGLLFKSNNLSQVEGIEELDFVQRIVGLGADLIEARKLQPKLNPEQFRDLGKILNLAKLIDEDKIFFDFSSSNINPLLFSMVKYSCINLFDVGLCIIGLKSKTSKFKYRIFCFGSKHSLNLISKRFKVKFETDQVTINTDMSLTNLIANIEGIWGIDSKSYINENQDINIPAVKTNIQSKAQFGPQTQFRPQFQPQLQSRPLSQLQTQQGNNLDPNQSLNQSGNYPIQNVQGQNLHYQISGPDAPNLGDDPLKPADAIPTPLIFFNNSQNADQNQQGPLP